MSSAVGTLTRVSTRRRSIPSTFWYWVAAAIVFLGLGLGTAWGVVSTVKTHDRASALPRTSTPGTLAVTAGDESSRLIYFEGEGRPSLDELGLRVTAPDGTPVPVEPYRAIMEYDIAGWVGSPIASFATPVQGTYTVAAERSARQGDISVGGNFVRTQALSIVGALALILVSFAVGITLVAVVSVRRCSGNGASRPCS